MSAGEHVREAQRLNQEHILTGVWLEQRHPGGAGMVVGDQVREVLWSQVRRGLEGCFEDSGFLTERTGTPRRDFSRGVEQPDAHFARAILTSELRRC